MVLPSWKVVKARWGDQDYFGCNVAQKKALGLFSFTDYLFIFRSLSALSVYVYSFDFPYCSYVVRSRGYVVDMERIQKSKTRGVL